MRPRALFVMLAMASLLALGQRPALALGPGNPPPAASASTKPATPAVPAPGPAEELAPDSPRASVKHFIDWCRMGEYAEAATYLDLSEAQKADGPQLAKHLKSVLDRWMWDKLDTVSASPSREITDRSLEIGVVKLPGGGQESIRLVRRQLADGRRWVFSRGTVDRIDVWFGGLRDRWQQEYFPQILLRAGPKDVLWWQYIALPVLFVVALGAGVVMGRATRLGIARFLAHAQVKWEHALFRRLEAPLTVLWAVAGVDLAVPRLALYPPAQAFVDGVVRAAFFGALVWLLSRGVEIGGARILELPDAKTNPAARSLVPLATKSLKVILVVFAVLAGLSELGVAVGSMVAGLGIGGVALALAAQKTVENLFGSLSIGVDQPFRVGDYVTVDTVSGTVESIGLRSTRIRTLDRTLVTLPNGKLADMRIESFAGRDRIKLGTVLALDRSATAAQVTAVVEGARALLVAHPKIWPEVTVALARISDASFDVEVLAWFQTTSWDEFLRIREEVLLGLLAVVEAAGAKLATPAPK